MTDGEKICIKEASGGLSPNDTFSKIGDTLVGTAYICERRIGGTACQHLFSFDPNDGYGIYPLLQSRIGCLEQHLKELASMQKQGKRQEDSTTEGRFRRVARAASDRYHAMQSRYLPNDDEQEQAASPEYKPYMGNK